ncbi:MAG: hypothetical protein JRI44_07735 [Deltaproteobacteria bacterium]|nr:hypothetical protein [Deltaproteobacteria bacterium]
MNDFWYKGNLDKETNVVFGEGGAGTFSDGKLTTRIKDFRRSFVLETFVKAGAPEEILYINHPHLGTDRLRIIIPLLREHIIKHGADIYFNTKVDELIIDKNKIIGIKAAERIWETDALFWATGMSARDSYEMILNKGVTIEPKPFAVGIRVEHLQSFINKNQFGDMASDPSLGPAEYFLTYTDKQRNRGVYSFCMCPGGRIICCSHKENIIALNGMSNFKRDGKYGNSAIVVTVSPKDFPSSHPLAGIKFQEEIEKKAFSLGGGDFFAPAQYIYDFIFGKETKKDIKCSYLPGVKPAKIEACFPKEIIDALKDALFNFDKKIKGFALNNGIMVGVETRTSSPVRIVRDKETFQSITVTGFFPIGEGSGYAGGIISSAVDGIKAAERIIPKKQ